ncbi:hypothetical protein PG985_005345 [Apiospora marii]|uniref:Uncharacterized protein n=1 Tax=Apiospora marii TaxID=335849 RepID=A0ABR1SBQ9_9PEZI
MPCNESDRSEWHKYDAVITSQEDIDNGPLRTLDGKGDVLIQGAKGSLNFTDVPFGQSINVICNPDLQKINFTEYFQFTQLNISEAPALTEIWMTPSNEYTNFVDNANISIRAAPKLGGGHWQDFNCSTLVELVLHDAGGVSFPYLNSVELLDFADTPILAEKLETISDLRMENSNSRSAPRTDFKALKSVTGSLYAGNAESHNGRGDDHKETVQGETGPAGAQLDDTHIREAGGRSIPHQVGGGEILEAGGRALPAEAGDQRTMVAVSALPQETKASPVELA